MTDTAPPNPQPGHQPESRNAPIATSDHPLAGTITIGIPNRGITLRRWWIVGAAVFGLLFLGVNLLYARSTETPQTPILNSPDRVTVFVNPYGIIPAEETIKTRVAISPPGELMTSDGLTQQLSVQLLNEDKTLTFAKGATSLSSDITMIAYESSYEKYPLDDYSLPVQVMASTTDAAGVVTQLPVEVVVWGKFPGWRVIANTSEDPTEPASEFAAANDDTPEGYDEIAIADLNVSRNGSTMSIVVLLLIAMFVLAVIAMVVARAVSNRKRRIEATMASWFAALLFAMVPLRTNMPGAPPIGVWIDFLVFLWVLIALMVALAIFVGSWLVFSPAPDSTAGGLTRQWIQRFSGKPTESTDPTSGTDPAGRAEPAPPAE